MQRLNFSELGMKAVILEAPARDKAGFGKDASDSW